MQQGQASDPHATSLAASSEADHAPDDRRSAEAPDASHARAGGFSGPPSSPLLPTPPGSRFASPRGTRLHHGARLDAARRADTPREQATAGARRGEAKFGSWCSTRKPKSISRPGGPEAPLSALDELHGSSGLRRNTRTIRNDTVSTPGTPTDATSAESQVLTHIHSPEASATERIVDAIDELAATNVPSSPPALTPLVGAAGERPSDRDQSALIHLTEDDSRGEQLATSDAFSMVEKASGVDIGIATEIGALATNAAARSQHLARAATTTKSPIFPDISSTGIDLEPVRTDLQRCFPVFSGACGVDDGGSNGPPDDPGNHPGADLQDHENPVSVPYLDSGPSIPQRGLTTDAEVGSSGAPRPICRAPGCERLRWRPDDGSASDFCRVCASLEIERAAESTDDASRTVAPAPPEEAPHDGDSQAAAAPSHADDQTVNAPQVICGMIRCGRVSRGPPCRYCGWRVCAGHSSYHGCLRCGAQFGPWMDDECRPVDGRESAGGNEPGEIRRPRAGEGESSLDPGAVIGHPPINPLSRPGRSRSLHEPKDLPTCSRPGCSLPCVIAGIDGRRGLFCGAACSSAVLHGGLVPPAPALVNVLMPTSPQPLDSRDFDEAPAPAPPLGPPSRPVLGTHFIELRDAWIDTDRSDASFRRLVLLARGIDRITEHLGDLTAHLAGVLDAKISRLADELRNVAHTVGELRGPAPFVPPRRPTAPTAAPPSPSPLEAPSEAGDEDEDLNDEFGGYRRGEFVSPGFVGSPLRQTSGTARSQYSRLPTYGDVENIIMSDDRNQQGTPLDFVRYVQRYRAAHPDCPAGSTGHLDLQVNVIYTIALDYQDWSRAGSSKWTTNVDPKHFQAPALMATDGMADEKGDIFQQLGQLRAAHSQSSSLLWDSLRFADYPALYVDAVFRGYGLIPIEAFRAFVESAAPHWFDWFGAAGSWGAIYLEKYTIVRAHNDENPRHYRSEMHEAVAVIQKQWQRKQSSKISEVLATLRLRVHFVKGLHDHHMFMVYCNSVRSVARKRFGHGSEEDKMILAATSGDWLEQKVVDEFVNATTASPGFFATGWQAYKRELRIVRRLYDSAHAFKSQGQIDHPEYLQNASLLTAKGLIARLDIARQAARNASGGDPPAVDIQALAHELLNSGSGAAFIHQMDAEPDGDNRSAAIVGAADNVAPLDVVERGPSRRATGGSRHNGSRTGAAQPAGEGKRCNVCFSDTHFRYKDCEVMQFLAQTKGKEGAPFGDHCSKLYPKFNPDGTPVMRISRDGTEKQAGFYACPVCGDLEKDANGNYTSHLGRDCMAAASKTMIPNFDGPGLQRQRGGGVWLHVDTSKPRVQLSPVLVRGGEEGMSPSIDPDVDESSPLTTAGLAPVFVIEDEDARLNEQFIVEDESARPAVAGEDTQPTVTDEDARFGEPPAARISFVAPPVIGAYDEVSYEVALLSAQGEGLPLISPVDEPATQPTASVNFVSLHGTSVHLPTGESVGTNSSSSIGQPSRRDVDRRLTALELSVLDITEPECAELEWVGRLTPLELATFGCTLNGMVEQRLELLESAQRMRDPLPILMGSLANGDRPSSATIGDGTAIAIMGESRWRLEALEVKILGQRFSDDRVIDRVVRLEDTVFGYVREGSILYRLTSLDNSEHLYNHAPYAREDGVGRDQIEYEAMLEHLLKTCTRRERQVPIHGRVAKKRKVAPVEQSFVSLHSTSVHLPTGESVGTNSSSSIGQDAAPPAPINRMMIDERRPRSRAPPTSHWFAGEIGGPRDVLPAGALESRFWTQHFHRKSDRLSHVENLPCLGLKFDTPMRYNDLASGDLRGDRIGALFESLGRSIMRRLSIARRVSDSRRLPAGATARKINMRLNHGVLSYELGEDEAMPYSLAPLLSVGQSCLETLIPTEVALSFTHSSFIVQGGEVDPEKGNSSSECRTELDREVLYHNDLSNVPYHSMIVALGDLTHAGRFTLRSPDGSRTHSGDPRFTNGGIFFDSRGRGASELEHGSRYGPLSIRWLLWTEAYVVRPSLLSARRTAVPRPTIRDSGSPVENLQTTDSTASDESSTQPQGGWGDEDADEAVTNLAAAVPGVSVPPGLASQALASILHVDLSAGFTGSVPGTSGGDHDRNLLDQINPTTNEVPGVPVVAARGETLSSATFQSEEPIPSPARAPRHVEMRADESVRGALTCTGAHALGLVRGVLMFELRDSTLDLEHATVAIVQGRNRSSGSSSFLAACRYAAVDEHLIDSFRAQVEQMEPGSIVGFVRLGSSFSASELIDSPQFSTLENFCSLGLAVGMTDPRLRRMLASHPLLRFWEVVWTCPLDQPLNLSRETDDSAAPKLLLPRPDGLCERDSYLGRIHPHYVSKLERAFQQARHQIRRRPPRSLMDLGTCQPPPDTPTMSPTRNLESVVARLNYDDDIETLNRMQDRSGNGERPTFVFEPQIAVASIGTQTDDLPECSVSRTADLVVLCLQHLWPYAPVAGASIAVLLGIVCLGSIYRRAGLVATVLILVGIERGPRLALQLCTLIYDTMARDSGLGRVREGVNRGAVLAMKLIRERKVTILPNLWNRSGPSERATRTEGTSMGTRLAVFASLVEASVASSDSDSSLIASCRVFADSTTPQHTLFVVAGLVIVAVTLRTIRDRSDVDSQRDQQRSASVADSPVCVADPRIEYSETNFRRGRTGIG